MATMALTTETPRNTAAKPCRFCGASLEKTFVDLGMSPLCETYPSMAELNRGEVFYPLHVYVVRSAFWSSWKSLKVRKIYSVTICIFLLIRIPG